MSKQVRICASSDCKTRLPDLAHDGHSRCSGCIGQLCSFNNHCIECAGWSNEVFTKYLKHRHVLELSRLRKAKQRSKAKLVTGEGSIQQSFAAAAHSVSPSPPTSIVNLSSSSSVSAYSPSANVSPLPCSPTTVASAPCDQVITRSEFDSLKSMMLTMASDLAALRKNPVDQVHSESAPPPLRPHHRPR